MPSHMSPRLGMVVTLLVALSGSQAGPVLADAAPPLTPPGSSIDPTSSTPVRMWSETVELDATGLLQESGRVHVEAVFRMRNTAPSRQNLRARFPLEHPQGIGDGWGSFPIVENLAVQVDSTPAPTAEVREPSYWEDADQSIRWAAFDVEFPVGEDVVISVEYDVSPTPGYNFVRLDYVLETGAGWFGPIALARMVVRLPYPANTDNYISHAGRWPAPAMSGNRITWRRWNLDPSREDNFFVYLVAPQAWETIRQLETRAANGGATPQDFAQLSLLYWRVATDESEMSIYAPLADVAERAARRGLALDPDSSELLSQLAYIQWVEIAQRLTFARRGPSPTEQAQIDRIRDIFLRAFELDRSNYGARDMTRFIEAYSWVYPDLE
jgi:hypothetical protein